MSYTFQQIRTAVNKVDPMDLLQFTDETEYDPEVSRLALYDVLTPDIIYGVFRDMFNPMPIAFLDCELIYKNLTSANLDQKILSER